MITQSLKSKPTDIQHREWERELLLRSARCPVPFCLADPGDECLNPQTFNGRHGLYRSAISHAGRYRAAAALGLVPALSNTGGGAGTGPGGGAGSGPPKGDPPPPPPPPGK